MGNDDGGTLPVTDSSSSSGAAHASGSNVGRVKTLRSCRERFSRRKGTTRGIALFVGSILIGCSSAGPSETEPALDGGASYTDASIADSSPDPAPALRDAGPPPVNPCVDAGTCPLGQWTNVTPSGVDLTNALSCGNYGTQTVAVDPMHPSNFYAQFNCQGIWKSVDYGSTWTGPINTGTNGATIADCAGGITLPLASTAAVPPIYISCCRGNGLGFWRSLDGGVNWTKSNISPAATDRQDVYPPDADPYDSQHLLMAGHEQNLLVESVDGGETWTSVSMDPGMSQDGGTAEFFFVNMGNAAGTRQTFLYIAQGVGGTVGTWRTTNGGTSWTRVDSNEHPHGESQIYQPDGNGVLFMAGIYSSEGWGVLRSPDYGMTWAHVGVTGTEAIVFGTPKNVYAFYGWAIGNGQAVDPSFETATQPATGTWTMPSTPSTMIQGPAQVATTYDGAHTVAIAADWSGGLWRFVEP